MWCFMNLSFKSKIIILITLFIFTLLYMFLFGFNNSVIGVCIVLAAFFNLGNDLSFKPKTSFVKISVLFIVLGIAAYFNNPLTIGACILTFIVVFITTYSSYNIFGSDIYMPYLIMYFMMIYLPVTAEEMPLRILSLLLGAAFIVILNVVVNRKKHYKISRQTVNDMINELDSSIDLKLAGEELTEENFKITLGFYYSLINTFQYKYFSTGPQRSLLNLVKSVHYIGRIVALIDLTENELKYIKDILSRIDVIDAEDIFKGIEFETDEMSIVLLNLEIISKEINKDLTNVNIIPDKNRLKMLLKPLFKLQFTFKSPKFTFAFKMAFIILIWQILALIFNLPFAQWLYLITVPLMIPYVDDLKKTANARFNGTFIAACIFAVIIFAMPYIPISQDILMIAILVILMVILVMKIEDKLIYAITISVISLIMSLMYLSPQEAIVLKLLWVVIGLVVTYFFNFKFKPYSVEKETKNNLLFGYYLNKHSIKSIKDKCLGVESDKRSMIFVVSNIIRKNIEVNDENNRLNSLQIIITDMCNFIVNYMDNHEFSDEFKDNMVDIIDHDNNHGDNSDINEKIISNITEHVKEFYNEETDLIKDFDFESPISADGGDSQT